MPFVVKKRVLNIHHDPHHHEEQMLEFIEMMGWLLNPSNIIFGIPSHSQTENVKWNATATQNHQNGITKKIDFWHMVSYARGIFG